MDSIANGPKVSDIETGGLRHCTLRLSGDGVSALAKGPVSREGQEQHGGMRGAERGSWHVATLPMVTARSGLDGPPRV